MGIQKTALLLCVFSSLFIAAIQMELREIIYELQKLHNFKTVLYFLANVTERERIMFMDRWNLLLTDIPMLLVLDIFKNEIWESSPKDTLTIFFIPPSRRAQDFELPEHTSGPFLRSQIIFDIHAGTSSKCDIKEFCDKLWSQRIVNSLILANNRTFTFDPYPSVNIQEISFATGLNAVYATKLRSFHGATLEHAWVENVLTYFKYTDFDGSLKYGGPNIKIIFTFLKKFNGTPIAYHDVRYEDIVPLLDNIGYKQFTFMPLAAMGLNAENEMSYPWLEKFCIIVPHQKELPRVHYLKLPFQTYTWRLYNGALLILFLIEVLIDVLFDIPNDIFCGSHAFFRVIRIVTAQLHFRSRLNQIRSVCLIHLAAAFLIQLMTSLYQSGLSSFYTKSIPGVQINDIKQLERSGYKILMRNELINLSTESGFLPPHLLQFSNEKRTSFEIAKLNTKFGYLLPIEFIKVEGQVENIFSVKFYHRTHMCNFDALIGISLEKGFPLKEAFDDTKLRLWETGIISFWKKYSVYELYRSGYFRFNTTNQSKLRPLKFDELQHIWFLYAGGISFSIIFFFLEKGWKFLKKIFRVKRIFWK